MHLFLTPNSFLFSPFLYTYCPFFFSPILPPFPNFPPILPPFPIFPPILLPSPSFLLYFPLLHLSSYTSSLPQLSSYTSPFPSFSPILPPFPIFALFITPPSPFLFPYSVYIEYFPSDRMFYLKC